MEIFFEVSNESVAISSVKVCVTMFRKKVRIL